MKVSSKTKQIIIQYNCGNFFLEHFIAFSDEFCFVHFTIDICTKFENLCSQICEPTDDSYVCKCRNGFRLAEDRKTCVKDDEDSADKANEVPINATEYGYDMSGWTNSNEC